MWVANHASLVRKDRYTQMVQVGLDRTKSVYSTKIISVYSDVYWNVYCLVMYYFVNIWTAKYVPGSMVAPYCYILGIQCTHCNCTGRGEIGYQSSPKQLQLYQQARGLVSFLILNIAQPLCILNRRQNILI